MHPFGLGEIACGNLKDRDRTLAKLRAIPVAAVANHDEAMRIMETWKLAGRGIGWIDTHLIAAALLSNCAFWTLDERLSKAAIHAGVKHYRPPAATH